MANKKHEKFIKLLCADFTCESTRLFTTYPDHSIMVEDFYYDNVDNRAEFKAFCDIYVIDLKLTIYKGEHYFILARTTPRDGLPYTLNMVFDLSI